MPRTYYDSELTGEQIEQALEAIDGLITPSNNEKVLCIENGEIVAKSASTWTGGYPEPTGTIPITANGTVNVKDYETAEVNVPSSITAADEGKVVKNGALVAQTARATEINVNGTYDTTENNSVTVNVSGGGGSSGIYVGTTDPDASIGNNGEYYYLREEDYIVHQQGCYENFNSSTNQSQGGYEFTANTDCYVIGLYALLGINNTNIVNVYLCAEDGTILAEVDNVSITESNTWVHVELPNPIHLTSSENYVVLVRRLSGSGNLKYTQISTHITSDLITFVQGRYGTNFPGTGESRTRYSADVDLILSPDKCFFIRKQYYKQNDAWTQIG